MKKYKAAIIGCGNSAGMYGDPANHSVPTHASAYNLCSQTTINGVMDPNQHQLNRFCDKWNIENEYTDLTSMMEEQLPDIISICSPTKDHYNHFRLLSGYPVAAIYAEKPLSYNLSECEEIVELTKNIPVAVNYFRRWNKDLAHLRNELNEGLYGDIRKITAHYTKGLINNGSHLLDLLFWFFNRIHLQKTIKLFSVVNNDRGADFLMSLDNGADVHFIHVPDVDYVYIEVEIICENSVVKITQRGQKIQIYKKQMDPDYYVFNKMTLIQDYETDWRYCFKNALDNLISSMENNGKINCEPLDALRVSVCCDEIIRSGLN